MIWQLGKATRTCEGFRYGGELRNYKWMGMVPETVHFYIGQNREDEDWYYAQVYTGSWYIHFRLEEVPASECSLIIALAGASRGGPASRDLPCLTAEINGRILKEAAFVNDGAVYRSATKNGRYRRLKIVFDPGILHEGENIVRLAVEGGMVMYDTVLLTQTL